MPNCLSNENEFFRHGSAIVPFGRSVRLLSTASAFALAIVAATPALAQDAQQGDDAAAQEPATQSPADDSIVVTGIRQRLETSQTIKRESDTFVDAITAEDIGALPDRSVNETLQRIPGVTINRFQGIDDPDHFSIEGSNVVIRGLSYVRSEFNGRDAFSVNSGRALGFNDISPELLGSVAVFKNTTADRIDGGISGIVDLRTRKPFDNRQLVVAGTIEGNYGDIRESLQPAYSGLVSNVFETGIGDIGVLVSYGRSKLYSSAFGSQIAEYSYRPDISQTDNFYVPRGVGVRQQNFNRTRSTFDASLQWEATDQSALLTLEYIRADANQNWNERSVEVDVFDRPAPNRLTTELASNPWVFANDGTLLSGALNNNGQLPLTLARRNQDRDNKNEDFSANIVLKPTDGLKIIFDGQYARASTNELDISLAGSANTNNTPVIDRTVGQVPSITFLSPDGGDPFAYYTTPGNLYYRHVLDHAERSEGDEFAFRADTEYEFDSGFLRKLSVGGRYSDREQTRRYSEYAWGFISQPWTGAGLSPYDEGTPVGNLEVFDFPDFQRGKVPVPVASLFTDLDLVQAYRDGTFQNLVGDQIKAGCCEGSTAQFLVGREGVIPGDYYRPGEINVSREQTWSAYARADFTIDNLFGSNNYLNGNIGVRYVNTQFETVGALSIPLADVTLGPNPAPTAIAARCAAITGAQQPVYCGFTPTEQATYFGFLNGDNENNFRANNSYDYFLPAFNVNLHLGDKFIVRAAVSRAISRPDFGRTAFSATIGGNQNALSGGSVPLFASGSGDPKLTAVTSTNFDLGLEYYFNSTSSVTLNGFYKKLDDVITDGSVIKSFTNTDGQTEDVQFNGPVNVGKVDVRGFELAYQQFFDFLPGPLNGLGFEGNYTYIDTSSFPSQVVEPLFKGLSYPLEGLSKHAYNVSGLYEKYGISARVSYNWRSTFLLTRRDVIAPFAPIFQPSTGQLDASIFYNITDNVKIGFQASNLLDDVTVTEQQTSFDANGNAAFMVNPADPGGPGIANPAYVASKGPRAPRSYFRNDRRFSFGVRFNF